MELLLDLGCVADITAPTETGHWTAVAWVSLCKWYFISYLPRTDRASVHHQQNIKIIVDLNLKSMLVLVETKTTWPGIYICATLFLNKLCLSRLKSCPSHKKTFFTKLVPSTACVRDEEGRPSRDEEGRPSRDAEGRPSRDEEGRPSRDEEGRPSRDEEGRPSRDEGGRPSEKRSDRDQFGLNCLFVYIRRHP